MRIIDQGLNEFLREYDIMVPKRKTHTLEHENTVEHMEKLHNLEGYYAYNDEKLVSDVVNSLQEVVNSDLPLSDNNLENALEYAGYQSIDFHRSYTGKFKPGVKANDGPREEHPGAWADVSGQGKAGYRFNVNGKAWRDRE